MRLSRRLLKSMVIFLDKIHCYWPIALCYALVIKKIEPRTGQTKKGAPRLLALNAHRFRGDLTLLADSLEVEIFIVPEYWQDQLISLYRRQPDSGSKGRQNHIHDLIEYFNPAPGSIVDRERKQVRQFLKQVLKRSYKIKRIQGVLSAAIHYKRDLDWGAVSKELGVKYIVLHKENLYINPASQRALIELWNQLGAFQGDHVIVHSELMQCLFLKSSFISSEQISVCGCLRQDVLVQKLREGCTKLPSERKKVVLFSFNHGSGFLPLANGFTSNPLEGFVEFFDDVHVAIAACAINHPDVDFLIKPKWHENWVQAIEESIAQAGMVLSEIENLTIDHRVDPLQTILEADIVIGFNSTTLFEAAVCEKTVIMPQFAEATGRFSDYVNRPEDMDCLFDIADSKGALIQLIDQKLSEGMPTISPSVLEKRRQAFEKYVSSLDQMAIELYLKQIRQILTVGNS